jgi:hypothetical protein
MEQRTAATPRSLSLVMSHENSIFRGVDVGSHFTDTTKLHFRNWWYDIKLQSKTFAAACTSFVILSARAESLGLIRRATFAEAGINSSANSSLCGPNSAFNWLTPVTLPPGHLIFVTRPI